MGYSSTNRNIRIGLTLFWTTKPHFTSVTIFKAVLWYYLSLFDKYYFSRCLEELVYFVLGSESWDCSNRLAVTSHLAKEAHSYINHYKSFFFHHIAKFGMLYLQGFFSTSYNLLSFKYWIYHCFLKHFFYSFKLSIFQTISKKS